MAILSGQITKQRGVAHRGAFYIRSWRGKIVVSAWPRKRSRPLHPNTLDQMDWFTQANELAKRLYPKQQIIAREATAGTPLLPRDLLLMLMAGRLFQIHFEGGGTISSMAARNDVSTNLDIIGQTAGDLLARGAEVWEAIPAGPIGTVLQANGPGVLPSWGNPGGHVRVRLSVDAFVPAQTNTQPNWSIADINDQGMWDANDPTVISVPTGVTRMEFFAGARFKQGAAGFRSVQINPRGQTTSELAESGNSTSSPTSVQVGTGPLPVIAGQQYEATYFAAVNDFLDKTRSTFFSASILR